MACVNPDGTITASAAAMLNAMKSPSTPEEIAGSTGLPLFRVRSGLRELVDAKMASENDGHFQAATRTKSAETLRSQ